MNKIADAIEYSKSFIGRPYKWGGETPMAGYDCCLAGDSIVNTDSGMKYITEIKEGDYVKSYIKGEFCLSRVHSVFDNGIKPVYKVKTTSSTLKATYNHKFMCVYTDYSKPHGWARKNSRKLVWKEVQYLKKGDIVLSLRNEQSNRKDIKTDSEVMVFGVMLGDGTIHSDKNGFNLCFVSEKKRKIAPKYITAFLDMGFSNKVSFHPKHGYMFNCYKTTKKLIDLGLGVRSFEKYLPDWVFDLNERQFDLFLQSYIDADGYRYERGSESGHTISTASKRLAEQLHNVLLSRCYRVQNIKVTERKKDIFIKGVKVKNPKTLYTIALSDSPIRMYPERGCGQRPYQDFSVDNCFVFNKITSVEPVNEEPTYDLSIVGSNSYIANGFVVHNSGFVQEIIRSVGLDPRGDQNSQALYNYFNIHGGRTSPQAGALAFYGKSRLQIIHVAFCLNDYQVIEAGGGGRKTVDIQSAIDHRAFVRIRPIEHRKDLLDCFMPDYYQD